MNVYRRRVLGGHFPRVTRRAEIDAADILLFQHQCEARHRHRNFLGREINQGPNRSFIRADNVVAAKQGAEPMRVVDHLAATHTGEQIFVST